MRLVQAAAEMLGGNKALARRLGVPEQLIAGYRAGRPEIPDALLLRIVDIILADRRGAPPAPGVLTDHPARNGPQRRS